MYPLELKALDGINKNELSMVEVAHAILEVKQEVMDFNQLLVEVQSYMELSDEQLEARMARFYTDLNISFHLEKIVGAYVHGIQLIQSMKKLFHQWMMKT